MSFLLLFAGCGTEAERVPVDDRSWNPEAIQDSLGVIKDLHGDVVRKGADEDVSESFQSGDYYDVDGDYHYWEDYNWSASYDTRGLDLFNGDLELDTVRISTSNEYDYWDGYAEDAWGDPIYYEDWDDDWSSNMSFSFRLYNGEPCRVSISRLGHLYDTYTDWRFTDSADFYNCEDELPSDQAVEGLNEVINED